MLKSGEYCLKSKSLKYIFSGDILFICSGVLFLYNMLVYFCLFYYVSILANLD